MHFVFHYGYEFLYNTRKLRVETRNDKELHLIFDWLWDDNDGIPTYHSCFQACNSPPPTNNACALGILGFKYDACLEKQENF